ncbi:AAA family ATPase [Photobacterium galatheae]|nr:AAA family ATPase [Photobacterium galatheae]MCM0151719.1 AAA family ATPase [Photobacterium galatheae]
MAYIDNVKFDNHHIFGTSEINLCSITDDDKNNYYSVVIGENGTGKSELLKSLSEHINYRIRDNIYNSKSKYNDNTDVNFKLNKVPEYLVVSASNLNDKFPNISQRNKSYHPNYRYLGIRSTTNNAFIGKYKREFLEHFIDILSNDKKIESLSNALLSIGLPKRFRFTFKKGRGMSKVFELIDNSSSIDKFKNEFEKLLNLSKSSNKDYKLDKESYFYKFSKSTHIQIESYEFIKSSNQDITSIVYEIDLDKPEINERFLTNFNVLQLMVETGLISIKDFYFVHEDEYSFASSSSGQFNIITSFIGIISNMSDNSILLIDEPEVSLHASWQIKYFDILKLLLKPFNNCHTIICTHSHFLVSSMKKEESTLIHIKKDKEGKIKFDNIKSDVWGWSPENILYNVFGISSTRNAYFEQDLRKIISVISQESGNPDEIIEPLERIKRFNITDEDPLSLVITRAENFIKEVL